MSFLQNGNRLVHVALRMKRHAMDVREANRFGPQLCSLREQLERFLLPAQSRFQQSERVDRLSRVRSDGDASPKAAGHRLSGVECGKDRQG
jgi:hypothetical protein